MAVTLVAVAAPVGTIFINLIRMTVIPLVVTMLVASVGSMASTGALGRAGIRAAAIAVALLLAATIVAMLIAQPVLARVHIDAAAATALRGSVAGPGAAAGSAAPGFAQWFVDLVPQNVFKSAADGVMLPIIVFSVLFGVALARVGAERREPVLRVVQGIADAMQRPGRR